ncbi:MAG: transglutaminase N-terminal domain-containing protein [Sphingomonas sp.]
MRLSVEHRTRYRFSAPQARLVQMLRLRPSDSALQGIADWRIDVDCDARLKPGQDGFGNAVTMLYAEGPIDQVEIAVTGEVITSDNAGVQSGVFEPFPAMLFNRATALTAPAAEITALAAQILPGSPLTERLDALCAALARRFTIDVGRPVRGQTAAQALTRDAVTARDLAHIFIACAQAMGAPARYITGYSLAALHRAAPHAWAEAFVDGVGWIGLDPAIGARVGEGHVRVAVGLDAAGAAPVAGFRLGDGEELLDVGVDVARLPNGG